MSTSSRSTAELQLKFFIERYRGSFGAVRLQSVWEILLHNYSPHISTTDSGQYTACTPQPPTINPRLRNIFIERGGGVICRLSTANAWGNFARSRPLHISTSLQGRYAAATPQNTTTNPIRRGNIFIERCGGVVRRKNPGGDFGRSRFPTTTHQHLPSRTVHHSHSKIYYNESHPPPKCFLFSLRCVWSCAAELHGKIWAVEIHRHYTSAPPINGGTLYSLYDSTE